MVIRENHANVEKSGRVLIPYYLSIWNSDDFTLYGLVSCMTRIFSHSPPVNARSSNTATANNNSSGTGPSRPPPTSTAGPNTNYNNNSNYPPSPHYPPQPSQYGGAGNQYGQPPPMFSHSTNGPGRNEAQGTGHYGGAGGHVPFNHRQNSEQRRQLVRSLTEQLTKRFAEQESKASSELISNVDEREKLNNSLQLVEQKKQKRRKLNEHHARLSDDHRKLSDWVESLGASVDVVNKDSDAGGETENNENGQQQQQVDVDLLVQYNDVVTDQMADCSAEDNALGDVLDQVDEALVKGVIDHDRYVREVRELSRKQFIPRALKKKLEIMRLRSSVSSNHHHSNSERQYAHRSADNSGPGMNAHLNARQQQQQRAAPHSVEYATA